MDRKLYEWYYEGGRIPRKIKKKVLDRRIKRRVLRYLLNTIKFGPPIKTMFERPETNHGLFCPHCGERGYIGTGNKAIYPEHWEYFHCLRCRKPVGVIDNSPFYHALQFPEDLYELPM
jgi:hypothetical protein